MGGRGSGGANKLSDEEKRRRGTFRPSRSEETYKEAAGAKVVAGPWLTTIPEPGLPLDEVGRRKYDEITKALFDQTKLTMATVLIAEQYALQYQQVHKRLSEGRNVPASTTQLLDKMLRDLRIAEEAPVIASPGEKQSKFRRVGFSTRLAPPG